MSFSRQSQLQTSRLGGELYRAPADAEQFLRYTHEQGIAHRHAKVDDIFPKGMMVEHLT